MEITIQRLKRVDIVKPIGRVDSATAPQLAETLRGLVDEKRCRVVLDMSELGYLSSAGLRVLIEAQRACRRWNRGNLVLAMPSDPIRRTLDLAGFLVLFEVYDSLVEAAGSI